MSGAGLPVNGNPPPVASVQDFVFLICRLLATVLLVLFGLGMLLFGLYAVKQRERIEAAYRGTDTEELALRCLRSMPWSSLLLGISALAASILVWVNPIFAVAIVALPFAVRFAMRPSARRY